MQRAASVAAHPQNVGSQRALEFARRGEVHDRALWTATAAATNGQGAATALVGTPETVAAAILDYVDRGASIVSIRGYDTLNDVIDYGRHVLPLVRQELAHRERTGSRGSLQASHLGALDSGLAALTQEVARTAAEYDRSGEVPIAGLRVAQRAGLLTATVGREWGGPGLGGSDVARILLALGEGDASVALLVANTARPGPRAAPRWATTSSGLSPTRGSGAPGPASGT